MNELQLWPVTHKMIYGYARVSTHDQKLDLQIDELKKAGCEQIVTEKVSAANKERPNLQLLLDKLTAGDLLIVWKLDRLGRSLKHLVEIVEYLNTKQAGLRCLNDPIDTTTPAGRLIFGVFAALAEFEREIIRERTKAGLNAARARGKKGGRPKGLAKASENKAIVAEIRYKEGILSVQEIARDLNISKSTLYRYLRHRGIEINKSSH